MKSDFQVILRQVSVNGEPMERQKIIANFQTESPTEKIEIVKISEKEFKVVIKKHESDEFDKMCEQNPLYSQG